MPITPAHLWQESETWVSIDVKIPNVTTSSADITTTECFVKVNSAPYIFEADLYGVVDCKMSKVLVGSGAVKFFLVKKAHGLWERLSMQGDRSVRLERREQSLEAARKEREKLRKEYPAKFSNLRRVSVGQQMRIDEVKRKVIEERKLAENLMEQENIETWKEDLTNSLPLDGEKKTSWPAPPLQDKEGKLSATCDAAGKAHSGMQFDREVQKSRDERSSSPVGKSSARDLGTLKNTKECKASALNPDQDRLTIDNSPIGIGGSFPDDGSQTRASPAADACKSNDGNDAGLRYAGVTLPAPRNCSTVSVTFSPKPDLPKHLPARESRDREIKLKKKSEKASEGALDVSERAPLFLQDKGDKFFKTGDYQSAVNAYTDALDQDHSLVISFANRGACKLHLKDYKACVRDCTAALCILTKGTPDCAEETILNQQLMVQETISAQNQNPNTPSEACNPPTAASCDMPSDDILTNETADTRPRIKFPVESLELLTILSGQACCSMRGLTIEGAGVEEWKLSIKKHMLIRRGFARYQIGDVSKAIDDYARSVVFKPNNDDVQKLLEEMRMSVAERPGKNVLSSLQEGR